MNKNELIQRLEDIEWEDFEVKEAKSEIPKNKSGTITNTITNTITKGDEMEKRIFEIIENNSYLSADEISNLVGLSRIGVRYHIKNLKAKNKIKRKGHGKGGSWEILG